MRSENRIEIGQIVQQPIERHPIYISPQLREIPAGQTINVYIARLKNDEILEVNDWYFKHFSQNSAQDVIVKLNRKNEQITRSGFQTSQASTNFSVVSPQEVTRLSATQGSPYNALSTLSGEGFPDNFYSNPKQEPFQIYGDAMVQFVIQNQSAVRPYSIEVFLSGVKLRTNARGASWDNRPVLT